MIAFETPFGLEGRDGGGSPYFIAHSPSRTGISASLARNGTVWEQFSDPRQLAIEVRAIPEPTIGPMVVFFASAGTLLVWRKSRHDRHQGN